MSATSSSVAAASGPGSNAAFYVLVVLHVACALTGFASVGFAGTYLARAARALARGEGRPSSAALEGPGGPRTVEGPHGDDGEAEDVEELERYFARPARLWWALLGVPVFGVPALAAQPDGGGLDQVWALCALVVWLVAVALVARVVLPGLHRVGHYFEDAHLRAGARGDSATGAGGGAASTGVLTPRPVPGGEDGGGAARAALTASRAAMVCDCLFVVALALMIWQPN